VNHEIARIHLPPGPEAPIIERSIRDGCITWWAKRPDALAAHAALADADDPRDVMAALADVIASYWYEESYP
jgi:hypothetical protein